MEGLNLTSAKFVYVRGKNRFGDKHAVLFEMEKNWDWVLEQFQLSLHRSDFDMFVKSVCDLRGVTVSNLPIELDDIHFAINSMKNSEHKAKTETYEKVDGFLLHKANRQKYISSYGCSCILWENKEAKRPNTRGYRTGVTAAKAVIRSLTALGCWKMVKIDEDSEVFVDNRALWEAASDFLVEGNHNKVRGYIPTEVFEASKTMQFVFEIDKGD